MNIPSGWKLKHIQNDFETFSGGTPNTKNAEYYKGTIPWIRSTEINQKIITETEKNISLEGLNNSSAKMVYPGYVLLALYGATAGEVAITNIEAAINQAVLAINAKNNDSSNDYLYYYLSYHKDRIINKYVQGGQPNLSGGIIKNLLYLSPPRKEQQKIASILSTWDEAIQKYTLYKDTLNLKKDSLLSKIFSENNYFQNYNVETVKLGDLFLEKRETGYEDYELLSITSDAGVVRQSELERKNTSSSNKGNYKLIEKGDLGYNTMRMWQGVVGYSNLTGIISPAYTVLTKKSEDVNPLFYYYYFKSPFMINMFYRYSQGLVKDTLSLKYNNFKLIDAYLPPIEVQDKIASLFSTIDKNIYLIEEMIEQLQEQKRGLMQLLLTGKVRV